MFFLSSALGIIISIVIVIAVIIVAVLIFAATRPDDFRIQRSATIKAPPDKIFGFLNDFHQWSAWSPWEKLDPNLKRTYSGTDKGLGAIYEWEGNKKVGQGRMEITQAAPPQKLVIKLDFIKPFSANNTAEYTLEPQGDSTTITWAMLGKQPFMFKVMSLFMSMDKMVGKDFEAGLSNLKGLAEK